MTIGERPNVLRTIDSAAKLAEVTNLVRRRRERSGKKGVFVSGVTDQNLYAFIALRSTAYMFSGDEIPINMHMDLFKMVRLQDTG